MGDDWLSSLCMMSEHRKRLEEDTECIDESRRNQWGICKKNLGIYSYYLKISSLLIIIQN